MDRAPTPRRGASGSSAQPPARRSAGSRVGLQKSSALPHPKHRVTAAEKLRQRRRRAVLGLLLVLLALVLGFLLTAKLLFKVREIRLENLDGTTPADTGIYTEEQIREQLAVPMGVDLLSVSAKEKTAQLTAQLPYLEQVEVHTTLPGTVVVKLQPAVERFALDAGTGWLILSDRLKVLRTADAVPDGAVVLQAALAQGSLPVTGQYAELQSYSSLFDGEEDAAQALEAGAAAETLMQLMAALDEQGLLAGTTQLSVEDLSELGFTYQGRVVVRLGTDNHLADKLHIAAAALLPSYEESLGATDRGVLEFYQYSGGELRAAFRPGDPAAGQEPAGDPSADAPLIEDPVVEDPVIEDPVADDPDTDAFAPDGSTDTAAPAAPEDGDTAPALDGAAQEPASGAGRAVG